jgi:hypothetical protein
MLAANRVKKFRRSFPQAKEIYVACKDEWRKFCATVTNEQKLAMAYQQHQDSTWIRGLDIDRVDDPDINDAYLYVTEDVSAIRQSMDKYTNAYCGSMQLPSVPDLKLKEKYPLIAEGSSYSYRSTVRSFHGDRAKDHMYQYMSTAYKMWKDEQDAAAEAEPVAEAA